MTENLDAGDIFIMRDLPPLLDYLIECTRYYLERWGYHWWEITDQEGNVVPWLIEFQKRVLYSRTTSTPQNNHDQREVVYRLDLKSIFHKKNFHSTEEIEQFVPMFLKHFIWGTRRHQKYFFERLGLGQSRTGKPLCETYFQAKILDDRSVFRQLEELESYQSQLFSSIKQAMNGYHSEMVNPVESHMDTWVTRSLKHDERSSFAEHSHSREQGGDEPEFLTSRDRFMLGLSMYVFERKESLNVVWGVGCDQTYVTVKNDPLFPLLPLKHEMLMRLWQEDLEKRSFHVTCYSMWNDQVLILADDGGSLAELYLLESRFFRFIMSILGSRCPSGSYFVGVLNETSIVIIRRAFSDGKQLSRAECKTFLRRLGCFIKHGKLPTLHGKYDLYEQHAGRFFQWQDTRIHGSFLPNFEFMGVEDLSSINLPSEVLQRLFRHFHDDTDENLGLDDGHSISLDEVALKQFFDERNPFSWRYLDMWFRPLPPLAPRIEQLLRNFNKHLHELPVFQDYFPENPLAIVNVPVFWAFSFHYAISMGSPQRFYVPLEELWNGFYSVQDLRKFRLALILARKLLSHALNVDHDELVVDFQIPAILQRTVAQEELSQMMLAFQQVGPEDFAISRADVDIIIKRLKSMRYRLTPFWQEVISIFE